MKKLVLLLILLPACSSKVPINTTETNTNFLENISFKDYKKKLEQYSLNNPYPDIDN